MIIAECAQNYFNMQEAKDLIRLAKENGADLAKFQLFDAMALYGQPNPYELNREQAMELVSYGRDIGIEVFFSVFDGKRVKWCEDIGIKRYKIAFRERYNDKLLEAVEKTHKPVFVSSDTLTCFDTLYCVARKRGEIPEYTFDQYTFDVFDGISDHTIGLDIAKIAIARGANAVEKHFAFSHEHGMDAQWAMTPDELRELKNWELLCQSLK